MRYLFITSFLLIVSLNADTIFNGQCVDSFHTRNNTTIYYFRSATPTVLRTTGESKAKIEEFVSNIGKFYYDADNNECVAVMDDSTEIFMYSLIGVLIGFTILFTTTLITLRVGAK